MHNDEEAGCAASRCPERGEDVVVVTTRHKDMGFRARVVGASGGALCVALCVLAAAGLDGDGGGVRPSALESVSTPLLVQDEGRMNIHPTSWPQALSLHTLSLTLREEFKAQLSLLTAAAWEKNVL